LSCFQSCYYVLIELSQSGNNVSVAATCRLISCTLQNPNLTQLFLDHEPSSCIGHDAWRSEALPVPHDDVAAQGWTAVLEYLRKVSVYQAGLKSCRLRSVVELCAGCFETSLFTFCPCPGRLLRKVSKNTSACSLPRLIPRRTSKRKTFFGLMVFFAAILLNWTATRCGTLSFCCPPFHMPPSSTQVAYFESLRG